LSRRNTSLSALLGAGTGKKRQKEKLGNKKGHRQKEKQGKAK